MENGLSPFSIAPRPYYRQDTAVCDRSSGLQSHVQLEVHDYHARSQQEVQRFPGRRQCQPGGWPGPGSGIIGA